jgi:hypothetical protein
LRFNLDKKVKTGTLVELGISLARDKEIFFSLGKVAWQEEVLTKDHEGRKGYATGVEFLKLDTTNKLRLMRFVHEKIKEAKDET